MTLKQRTPGWREVKSQLTGLDKVQLLALVNDLYVASKEAQSFLHTRYALNDDILAPYKASISQWINPRNLNNPLSVTKAKKAITDYKKASGQLMCLAELGVFYCEEVFDFLNRCAVDEEPFYDSLCVMFAQALASIKKLPQAEQEPFIARMWQVRLKGNQVGWSIWDGFEQAWDAAGLCELDE